MCPTAAERDRITYPCWCFSCISWEQAISVCSLILTFATDTSVVLSTICIVRRPHVPSFAAAVVFPPLSMHVVFCLSVRGASTIHHEGQWQMGTEGQPMGRRLSCILATPHGHRIMRTPHHVLLFSTPRARGGGGGGYRFWLFRPECQPTTHPTNPPISPPCDFPPRVGMGQIDDDQTDDRTSP